MEEAGIPSETNIFIGVRNNETIIMEMKQLDVYLASLDPTVGTEIKKTRPGVIVSPGVLNKYVQTVIIAPVTRTIKGYPSRIVSEFQGQQGEIVLDQIRSVDKSMLVKKLGVIDLQTGRESKKVLQTMFG